MKDMFHIAKLILMPENYEIPTLSSRNLPNITGRERENYFWDKTSWDSQNYPLWY